MEILDFLFSNIAFLIALIWFVASMFSNKGKQERERNKIPRPVAQSIDEPEPVAQPREESRPVYQPFAVETPRETVEQLPTEEETISQRTAELLAKVESIQNRDRAHAGQRITPSRERLGANTTLQEAIMSSAISTAQEKKVIDLSRLDRQSVVQGMVWSQVFGLPRSKEPHRPWPRYVYTRHK